MAQETLTGRTARVALENGTDDQGNIKTVAMSLGTLSRNTSAWDADKALAIVGALAPCLNKAVQKVETVATYNVQAQ